MDRTTPKLPPDLFESLVSSLAEALVKDYREQWTRRSTEPDLPPFASVSPVLPTWLKIRDAASRAQCSQPTIRREVRAGRLRAAKVGGRRSLRFRADWVDQWLQDEGHQK